MQFMVIESTYTIVLPNADPDIRLDVQVEVVNIR